MVVIEIKHGQDPKLRIPRFICDKPLKADVPSPYHLLVDGFRFMVICGRPQSGKTSHMVALFRDKRCLKKTWNNIILCCPQESLNSLASGDNIFADLHPSKFFTDIGDIDVIREMVKFYSSEGETSVLIIDDQTAKLKSPEVQKVLADIVFNRRHYRCSIICLVQVYNSLPLMIRKLINTCIIQFKPSKKELETVFGELLEEKDEVALEVSRVAFQKPYDWLLIDVPSQRLFKRYDELYIKRDAEEAKK